MRKLLSKQGFAPDVLVIDSVSSYACVRRQLGMRACHEQDLRESSKEDNFHQVARWEQRRRSCWR
jgi:transposase-like protein